MYLFNFFHVNQIPIRDLLHNHFYDIFIAISLIVKKNYYTKVNYIHIKLYIHRQLCGLLMCLYYICRYTYIYE